MVTFSNDGNCYSNSSFFLACCSGHVCESTGHRYCCSLRSHQRRGHTQHATADENLTPQSAAFFASSFRFSFWTFCHEALLSQLLTTTPMFFCITKLFPHSDFYHMGTWCSGITPAQHAGGPGINPQCVQCLLWIVTRCCWGQPQQDAVFRKKTQCMSGHCYHQRKKSIDMVYCSSFCTLYKHLWSSGYDVSLTRWRSPVRPWPGVCLLVQWGGHHPQSECKHKAHIATFDWFANMLTIYSIHRKKSKLLWMRGTMPRYMNPRIIPSGLLYMSTFMANPQCGPTIFKDASSFISATRHNSCHMALWPNG